MVKLSIVQFTPSFCNKQHNFDQIEKLLSGTHADIIVLPELCTTGYSFLTKQEAFNAAEDASGPSMTFFRRLAAEFKAMIIAGFAEKDGDNVYNSALAALPDGNSRVYRKTHLFFREKLCFEGGNSGFFIVEHPFMDCRVGIMVCNDWRYPEAARSLALMGADVIACPSNLVSTLWGVAMPARALENKVYIAVANRCGAEDRTLEDGSTQRLVFNGSSVIYDFNGTPLVQADNDESRMLTVEITPQLTRDKSFNAFNDLFKDRRPDQYALE